MIRRNSRAASIALAFSTTFGFASCVAASPTPTATAQVTTSPTSAATASSGPTATAQITDGPTLAVTFSGQGCTYEGPESVSSEVLSIAIANATSDTLDIDVWRLGEGHAYAELVAHIAEERQRIEDGRPPLGLPTFATLVAEVTVLPNETGALTDELEPGTYGIACIDQEQPLAFFPAGPFTVE